MSNTEDDYTPTTDEVRLGWWMTPDNPADNEGASDLSFDRWLNAVTAIAWDEGYHHVALGGKDLENPYRVRS